MNSDEKVATLQQVADYWSGRTRPPRDTDSGEYSITHCYGDDTYTLYGSCLLIAKDAKRLAERPDIVVEARHDPNSGAWIKVKASDVGSLGFSRQMSDEAREAAGRRLRKVRAAAAAPEPLPERATEFAFDIDF